MRSINFHFLILILGISLLWTISKSTVAQSSLDHKWYVNIHAGASQLFGDIQTNSDIFSKIPDETEIGYGIRFGRNISPVFGAYFNNTNGKFIGVNKSGSQEFHSEFSEFNLGLQVNITNLIGEQKNRTVNPYLFAGIGLLTYRSEAIDPQTGEIIGDAGYTKNLERKKAARETGLIIPVGAGLDFRLASQFYINLETGLRLSTSDLLDGIEKGSQNDAYYYTSLGVSYQFGRRTIRGVGIVDTNSEKIPVNPFANTPIDVQCVFPPELTAMDEFTMKCRVSKGQIDGKAELTQVLPIGFTVLDTAIANASRVEFKDYTLYLYWDELPIDSVFEVNYNVQLDKIYGNLPMSSILYLDRMAKEYKFKEDVNINRLIEPDPIVEIDEEPIIEKIQPEVAEVEFRVQIKASYKKALSIQTLEETYNLHNQIREEKIGYWYKYTAGSFRTYDAARDYRNTLIKTNKVNGPFVIAYFNGSRLSNLKELQTVSPDYYPYPFIKTQSSKTPLTKYCYRVQILALFETSESVLSLKQKYAIDEVINEEVYHSWRKYTVGDCFTKSQALKMTKDLKSRGLNGAFPVLYKDGERTTEKETKK